MPVIPIHLQSRVLHDVEAQRDRDVYGDHRSFDYLDDPYLLAADRGVIYGQRVA